MRLAELPGRLSELSVDLVVFATQPWTPNSEMILQRLGPDGSIPEELRNSTFHYFLELSVIDEFIDSLVGLTEPEQLNVIIYYAENDAFPEWWRHQRSCE